MLSEQLSLFNEAEELAAPKVTEPRLEQITYQRRKRVGKREMDFSGLPVEQVAHELSEKERVCPECGGALPLYRQELARIGVPISRQTMANWIMAAHERWLAEFVQMLRRELPSNEILHADETTLMVLKEPGRKARQRSYVLVYRTSGDTRHPVVLYDYQPSRAGECAGRFLEGLTGLLHTDGYEVCHCKLPPEITVVGCWAHMRRKFTDTLKSLPQELRDRSPAKIGVDYCDKLFRLESGFTEQNLSFQERHQARLEQSKPVAEKFFVWAKTEYEKNPVPKSMFGAALTNAVNQEGWLMNVFLGRAAGAVQQPGGAGCTPLCSGAEELAVIQHAEGR